MKKLLVHSTVLVTILFAISCRKYKDPLFDGVNCSGKCFDIAGKLIDSSANSGITRGEIKFYFNDNTGTFSNKKIYLGRAVTDANGNYTFKFDGSRFNNVRGYYYAEAYKDNLFHDPFYGNRVSTFNLDSTLYNIPIIQNFSLFKPAILNVRVIANTITASQSLSVSYTYGIIGNGIVLNGGRSIDTTLSFKTAGDLRTFISADIRSVGFSNSKKDTIIVNSNTTKNHEIRF
jgi:hypothetical protein